MVKIKFKLTKKPKSIFNNRIISTFKKKKKKRLEIRLRRGDEE